MNADIETYVVKSASDSKDGSDLAYQEYLKNLREDYELLTSRPYPDHQNLSVIERWALRMIRHR